MDWDPKETERKKRIAEERKRLMEMSEADAEKLPTPERYQRLRYIREVEAHEWLMELRRKMPAQPVEQPAYGRKNPSNTAVVKYRKWED